MIDGDSSNDFSGFEVLIDPGLKSWLIRIEAIIDPGLKP